MDIHFGMEHLKLKEKNNDTELREIHLGLVEAN